MQSQISLYKETALVLGLGVSGLGIVRSLAADKKIRIIGIGIKGSIGASCKYLHKTYLLDKLTLDGVVNNLIDINRQYSRIIPFPTGNDFWLKAIIDSADKLKNFIVDYPSEINDYMSKGFQEALAKRLGIPFPQSFLISSYEDIEKVAAKMFPVVVKPLTRNTASDLFRILLFEDPKNFRKVMRAYIKNATFIVSQFIPGNDSMLYTYGSYAKNGEIVAEFTGRKLTQRPSVLGCVGLAEKTAAINRLTKYSRAILSHLNFTGISQIEFKFSEKEDRYYLMEMNPRSWMWVYLATEAGVNLALSKYYTETNRESLLKNIQGDNKEDYLFIDETSILYHSFVEKRFAWLTHILNRLFSHHFVFATLDFRDIAPSITSIMRNLRRFFRI